VNKSNYYSEAKTGGQKLFVVHSNWRADSLIAIARSPMYSGLLRCWLLGRNINSDPDYARRKRSSEVGLCTTKDST
jgi:hypothetical protein